ncbi:MAG: glutamyl-tRNA reductase [Bacteroidota bacterium]
MPGGIDFFVMGLSHRTAPLAVRERLAVAPEMIVETVRSLAALSPIREAALLSTCNRVEVYAASLDPDAAIAALRRDLAARAGTTEEELGPHLYVRVDVEAVHHLFRVAASLDSQVVGEPQILGQVKQAHDEALKAGVAGPLLGACFTGAFRIARRVRRDTEIARNPVSLSSVAIEYARKIFEGFVGRTVLLVGAGKMADLAARALRGQGADLVITNRTAARAAELAARIGGEVHTFEDIEGALIRADIVIASTGARQPVLTRKLVERAQRRRRGRPLFLIDIAVPRDVESGCADISDVFVADIDDLQKQADEHKDERRGEADRAEVMVEQEVGRFLEAFRGRRVGPTISALRAHVLAIARAEAERSLAGGELSGAGERERRAVLDLAESIAKKLLHAPQVVLKKGGADPVDGAALVAAVQRLFELEVAEPGGAAEEADRDADAAATDSGVLSGKVAGT